VGQLSAQVDNAMKNRLGQTTCVHISASLSIKHRRFTHELRTTLGQVGVELAELSGAADIWARDYLPIQRHDGGFVSFTYSPDYLRNGYRHLITDWSKVSPLPEMSITDCGLILDGGNVVLQGHSAIVTKKVFSENSHLTEVEVERRLREAFQLDKLIFTPNEEGDIWGHADGMVAWIGPGRVVVNDYRKTYQKLHRDLKSILRNAGIEAIEIPYSPDLRKREIPSAKGNYTNLLILPEIVLLPVSRHCFG